MAAPYKTEAGKRNYRSYYSGTDIRIYFGNLWVDEIVEIEWSLQEQVAPIYGFASHTWDRVARGNRFVSGQFVINFKEVGYLQTIMNSLSSDMKENKEWFNMDEYNGGTDGEGAHKGASVEAVLENFEKLAASYQNDIWGAEADSTGLTKARKNDSYFYTQSADSNNKELKDHGFNILLNYGEVDDTSKGKINPTTKQSIVGVQLTGLSQRIDPSGNPVSEVYSFIAKDVTGNVTQAY